MLRKMLSTVAALTAILLVAVLTGAWSSNPSDRGDNHANLHRATDEKRDHSNDQRRDFGDRFGLFHDFLSPVPHNPVASGDSHTTARAFLVRVGDRVLAYVHVEGAAPGLVHAQHIHGIGMHACPTIHADTNHDGLISTTEGQPAYGPIVVSLTTTGDTSPASGLAVSRFPTANANGSYTYVRWLHVGTDIPMSVANNLDSFHIVVHGIDTNHNGMYDFSKGASDLDPSLPQEATVPTACGLIH